MQISPIKYPVNVCANVCWNKLKAKTAFKCRGKPLVTMKWLHTDISMQEFLFFCFVIRKQNPVTMQNAQHWRNNKERQTFTS